MYSHGGALFEGADTLGGAFEVRLGAPLITSPFLAANGS